MRLDVWHFIMRYVTVILNPSKNPHWKEVVAEISACILKKHAEGGNPAKYWDQNEQKMRLTSTFEKWACKGTIWSAGACRVHEEQLKHIQKGCLKRQQQDIQTDGSCCVHTSGIVTLTGLCHDFILRQTSATCCLPELIETTSEEHFGLVKSSFASTFGGLLDVKTEESPIELNMTGPKFLEALSGEASSLTPARPTLIWPSSQQTLSHNQQQSARQMTSSSSQKCQLPMVTPSSTPPNPVAGTTAVAPIPMPPGMTRSQQFFTIAMRINSRAMHISSNVEFHLFMDIRAEFAWISFKMMPKQWAAATETYNGHLEEKNCANGSKMVKKNPQALL
ncbi:hypothetical protein BDR03DRAFT_935046 [Suillus americanus]|nr:hypothetical protein BDR03DRAFT_935046 [Suillus americanus]